jgi:ubiquinone/menaquinone biosynthesis C-methylase UbiE
MRADNEPGQYVLGHSEQELARLERQADLFRAETTDTLRRAGLTQGMHVLDVGCGTGDVAMVAAELVGPSGSVLGIDTAEEALAAARARAARLERDWLRFERSDIHGFEAKGDFDAVTGRFIFLHLADPAGALKHLAGCLRPGGIAAFIEMDIEQAAASPCIRLGGAPGNRPGLREPLTAGRKPAPDRPPAARGAPRAAPARQSPRDS